MSTLAVADKCDIAEFCRDVNARRGMVPARQTPISDLFKDAKKGVEQVIAKGRVDAELSQEEMSVIRSIRATDILSSDHEYCAGGCITGTPAFYVQGKSGKGVCLCPSLDSQADEFNFFILAHEIAHGSDLCAFTNTKLPIGQHPFELAAGGGSVVQCLEANGIRADNGKNFSADQLKDYGGGHKHCLGQVGKSQITEAAADLAAFEALGERLKKVPLKGDRAERFLRIFGEFGREGCKQLGQSSTKRDPKEGEHPGDLERAIKIGFSIPSIRAALGCQGHTQTLNCEYRPHTRSKFHFFPSTAK